ncbi:MAG: DUF5781 family protein [Thermoplasmatota archaeon]
MSGAVSEDLPDLERAKALVLKAMAEIGYGIDPDVRVHVVRRPGLPQMATTFSSGDGRFTILVSDRADGFGNVEGLLAHELSHVQRMSAHHPSHEDAAITSAYASVPASAQEHEYQRAILHHVINFTQDFYADPIAFRVIRNLRTYDERGLDQFLESFVADDPFVIDDARQRRWDHGEDVVGNARGVAMIRGVGSPEAVRRAQERQRTFLARIEPSIASHAPWFDAFFAALPPDPTESAFAESLVGYVQHFVTMAEGA